jgi:hypothetical protein
VGIPNMVMIVVSLCARRRAAERSG